MNVALMRLEHPLLVGEALLLIGILVFDLHRLPRPFLRRPWSEQLM